MSKLNRILAFLNTKARSVVYSTSLHSKYFLFKRMASSSTSNPIKRVGFIGIGVMGKSMCGHIIKNGYDVLMYNRTVEKMAPLVELGGKIAPSVAELAKNSEVVFSILGYPSDVRSVVLGDNGVIANLAPGSIYVDMTTSEPTLAREIYEEAKKKGVQAIDAPVSGGDIGAREARLSIMMGGDEDAIERVRPILQVMGQNIKHLGGPGSGQNCKMVNQILISTTMIGMVEGLIYGAKAGLDLNEVIKAVGSGAAGSWSINNYGPRILQRNFEPGFFVEHFIKDMKIALSEAQRMNLNLPGLKLALEFYQKLESMGQGRKGTQALMLVLEDMNKFEVPLGGVPKQP
eukprot:TRINITY_DN4828_c0_g2_i1.p1 TRINITY_DN4828_c0_g2~~TRINITY_DN4828_c0_g2_i1.p1  ORF type:complete len:345 (-),score=86.33 TRINITY_DN4828_c0_g2_i1:248-1282(-)